MERAGGSSPFFHPIRNRAKAQRRIYIGNSFSALAVVAALVDQLIKRLVVVQLKPVGSMTAIPGLLDFTYLENRGAAFGMLQDQRWFFIVTTGFITILLIAGLFVYKKHSACSIAASILIIGGGIGNLIDRIFLGYVVDYIHVSFFPPIFNFADCCVTVGTVLLMIHILFFLERKNEKRLDSHE
ncbi:signal peptidase II [Anaeromassilibacillus sp. SJQ-1]|uniref:signal peptidase II n=1 Tax=Anaeromassilibacillus sp. SJQ-1 TaxID=3375419 RepID=UPI003989C347